MIIKLIPKNRWLFKIPSETQPTLLAMLRELNNDIDYRYMNNIMDNGCEVNVKHVPIELRRNICAHQFVDSDEEIVDKIRKWIRKTFNAYFTVLFEYKQKQTNQLYYHESYI